MEPEVKIDPDKIPSKTANIVITDSPEPGSTTKLTLDDMFKIELDANPNNGHLGGAIRCLMKVS